jgi:hypothetical protein
MYKIHSKLVFFLNVKKINTLQNKKCPRSACEQCKSIALFTWRVHHYAFMLIALFIEQCN